MDDFKISHFYPFSAAPGFHTTKTLSRHEARGSVAKSSLWSLTHLCQFDILLAVAQRHPGRERNTADRNYRPGHEEGCEEGCQDSAEAQSQSGVRKPHSAVRSRGRRRPSAALNR
jgi:hypothetical protein